MTVAVDTSALIAIINAEPEAGAFLDVIGMASEAFVSSASLFEAHCVLCRSIGGENVDAFNELVERLELTVVAFDSTQLKAAKSAYSHYGRGSQHAADLNMGDCFSYALAKSRNLPLLYKGNDFVHTDIEPALKPA